jgi:AbrB family looped-hinge helix DNA binding protein
MATATLTSKGQITLPQEVRETLGLATGDKVDFVPDAAGGFRVVALKRDISDLRGRFAGRASKPVRIEEMAEAVLAEAAERARSAPRLRATRSRRSR